MTSPWLAYNDLAWTEDFFADPSDYEEEVTLYVDLLKRSSAGTPQTLLHLGCGAGGHDTIFKRHFAVTGVDLSPGMLNKAREAHPEIEYHQADMRTVRLQREFDAVVIPDSIDYMVTREDLRQALHTATTHLKPGGVLLVVTKTAEIFRDNNFAYTGEKEDVHVTLLENNYVNPHRPETYEATMVFLIRQAGKLTMHNDHHVLGLFPEAVWEEMFQEAGLTLQTSNLDGLYDRFLLGEGEYPMKVFVGVKPSFRIDQCPPPPGFATASQPLGPTPAPSLSKGGVTFLCTTQRNNPVRGCSERFSDRFEGTGSISRSLNLLTSVKIVISHYG